MEENKQAIEEILKKLNDKSNSVPDRFRNSELEFEIGNKAPEEERPAPEIKEEHEEEVGGFSIFDIAEREENGAVAEDVLRVKTTYMPRFTSASEKFNRLGYVPEDDGSDALKISAAYDEDKLDPTAEIGEGERSDAKIVSVNSGELITDSSTLFKFDDNEKTKNDSRSTENEESESIEGPEAVTEETEKPSETEKPCESVPVALPEPQKTLEDEEEKEEETEKNPGTVDIDEPFSSKLPERYVPVPVAKAESITGVGDAIGKSGRSEFTASHKRDGVKDRFLDTILSQKIRFIVALAISLALLVFENLDVVGVDLINVFHFEGRVNALAIIDMQFVICIALLALPEIIGTIKSLGAKRIKAEICLVPAFIVYAAYSLTVIITSPVKYSLFGLLFAVLALSAIASSYFRTNADFVSFKIISGAGEKQIVDNKYTRTLDSENFALDGVIEEYKSKTARVFKTSFVADFFRRTKSVTESASHVAQLTLVPLGVSFVIAAAVYFIASGFLSAVTAFSLVYLLSVPSFAVLANKLPHYYASEEAYTENGTLIGENAYFDYAGIDVICFEDTEIFTSEDVNIQRIRLYRNNEDLTKVLRQMSALFMNIGGPLDVIFSSSLDKKWDAASGIIIKENGLIGDVLGKRVMAGSYDFMVSEGVTPPTDEDDGRKSFDATTVMYAAEDGEVYAKFYVRYRFSEEFTMLLSTFGEEKIVPLVYTRDPNLTNELMQKLTAGTSTVRILKKNTTPVRDFAPSRVSAGMVSNGDKGNLVNLILLARRYARFAARVKLTERSAMIVGLSLGALISVSKMLLLPSALLSVWQITWCAALFVLTGSFFKRPKKHKEKRKNAK